MIMKIVMPETGSIAREGNRADADDREHQRKEHDEHKRDDGLRQALGAHHMEEDGKQDGHEQADEDNLRHRQILLRAQQNKGVFFVCNLSGMVIPRAFLCIDRKHDHQRAEGISWVGNLNGVCIGPILKLLGDMRHGMPVGGKDVIVPFPKAAFNAPAIAVDMVAGPEKRQLSAQAPHIIILTCVELKLGHPCKYLFFDAANRAACRIKDSQAMPPGKLTLDHKQGIPIFIVNIIAVEPGEHPLLEKHLHCVSSLHLPAQYLLQASHLLALCLL